MTGYPPDGLREFGMAIEITSDEPRPTYEEITAAGKMIAFNFRMTKMKHPEYGLDNYEFVSGPSLEVWEYGDCSICGGAGVVMGPDDCWLCDGMGRVVVGIADPPRWRHNFGWYALGPGG